MARRRRRERIAGAAVVLLGIVVAAVAIFALRNPKTEGTAAGHTTAKSTPSVTRTASTPAHSSASGSSTTPSSSSSSSSGDAVGKLPLVVLNNTTINHLARDASEKFRAAGWTVTKFDSYSNDIVSTAAYYDPDVPGAKEAAEALQEQFPGIQRVVPQFSELASFDSPIVVILNPDYQP